ncbi:MAG: hypothetical protein RMN24_12460 [Anaerolineae bacterium]|nr:hypothetical protein [Caldilineales bacterium]MCX7852414.1 hypothetical protein [Caldilineales bacterium]MDW8269967.1 hypothetical protein [Anaerolineae bacterium]
MTSADRAALIARKNEVIAAQERLRRELARLEEQPHGDERRRRQLLRQLEALMAEEYRLRLAIDRAR